ncbi:MAG: hypothetical protein KJ804_12180 [Proteobacteria bacterium]|nr:hypothetical protein [Pseudomonadota bacterium]
MEDFDKDPLDLFDDDGDGVNEMCLLFDEDKKQKGSNKPQGNNGCCIVFLMMGSAVLVAGWGVTKLNT